MAWIVVVPADEVGGPLQVVGKAFRDETKLVVQDAYPLRFDELANAVKVALRFRCGIVVEERDGEWILPKL